MRRYLVVLVLVSVVLVGCSSGTSTTAVRTDRRRPSVARTVPPAPITDPADPPPCGVAITASMPPATRAWVIANHARNAERIRIDAHLAAEGDVTSVEDVRAQVASDTEYAAALHKISFPYDAESLAADYLEKLGEYDAGANLLLDQVAHGVDFATAYTSFKDSAAYSAAGAFTEASANLRRNLGIPLSSCVFRTP